MLIEIEGPLRRRFGLVFLGLLQQFFELLLHHFAAGLVRGKALFEHFVAARCLSLEISSSLGQIIDHRLLNGLLVVDHSARFGIDVKGALATGA